MVLDAQYYTQACANDDVGRVFSEIDFTINSNTTNPSIEDEQNLREIIKHEWGHAHMLAHSDTDVVTAQNLLHYTGNLGGVIQANDVTGANLVFTNSNNIVQGSCGIPISTGNCGGDCSTNSIDNKEVFSYDIYPNPSDGFVNIMLKNGANYEDFQIRVMDARGIIQSSSTTKITLESSFRLELPKEKGIYLLEIIIGKQSITEKIVRL